MRTFLVQTNPFYNKQYSYHAIHLNSHNNNNYNKKKKSKNRTRANNRMIHNNNNSNSNDKAMNELKWLRRMSSTTLKRQRTHTEETVTEAQEEEEEVEHDKEINLESPISSSSNASSFLDSKKKTGNSNSIKKSVSFCNTVSVHHHPLILGDHPAVRNGVPLMLDWTALYSEERHLRDKSQSKTKNTLVPALSLYVREVLAQQAGATKDEMCAAREQVRAIQSSRQQSMAYRRWWPWPK